MSLKIFKGASVSASSSALVTLDDRPRATSSFSRETSAANTTHKSPGIREPDLKRCYSLGDVKLDSDRDTIHPDAALISLTEADYSIDEEEIQKVLHTLFPTISLEVINAVLQANEGSLVETAKYLRLKGW